MEGAQALVNITGVKSGLHHLLAELPHLSSRDNSSKWPLVFLEKLNNANM